MNQEVIKKLVTKRNIILLLTLTILSSLLYAAATHGRVSIKNLGSKSVYVTPIVNGELGVTKEVSNESFLRSGTYVIRNNLSGFPRSITVSVPRWWQTTSVTYQPAPNFNLTRTAALTYENYFRVNDKPISFASVDDTTTTYTVHSDTDAFGGKYTDVRLPEPLTQTITTSSGDLLGIRSRTVKKYSFATGSFTDILPIDWNSEHILLQRSSNTDSDVIALYQPASGRFDAITAKNNQSKQLGDILSAEDKYSVVAIDANETTYAFVSTKRESASHDDSEEGHHLYTYSAYVSPINAAAKKQFSLGQAAELTAIAVSPSGKFLAALKDGAVWVYNTNSGAIEFAGPFQDAEQILWRGDVLYSVSPQKGISIYDTKTRELVPVRIARAGDLTLSKITAVNSKLYVTAFSKNYESDLPDGYELEPVKESDGITGKLSTILPYKGEEYEISYLRNTVYIRVNYFPLQNSVAEQQKLASIRKEAQDKIPQLIDAETLRKLTIAFAN